MTDDELPGATLMREFVPSSPFAALLGITIADVRPDEAVLSLPDRPEHITIGTTVHGGAIATLVDTAAMVAAWSAAELPEQLRGATVDLTVHYLAAAEGEVTAHARVLDRGRRLIRLRVDARDAHDQRVATALATYQIG